MSLALQWTQSLIPDPTSTEHERTQGDNYGVITHVRPAHGVRE